MWILEVKRRTLRRTIPQTTSLLIYSVHSFLQLSFGGISVRGRGVVGGGGGGSEAGDRRQEDGTGGEVGGGGGGGRCSGGGRGGGY